MPSYIIEGGKRLEGEVSVSGSKNASLPILASTILNAGTNVEKSARPGKLCHKKICLCY